MTKTQQDMLTTMRSGGASPGECRMALTLVSLGVVDASTWANHWMGADQLVRMFGEPVTPFPGQQVSDLPPLTTKPDAYTGPHRG